MFKTKKDNPLSESKMSTIIDLIHVLLSKRPSRLSPTRPVFFAQPSARGETAWNTESCTDCTDRNAPIKFTLVPRLDYPPKAQFLNICRQVALLDHLQKGY